LGFSVLAPAVFAQSSVPLTLRLKIFDELLVFAFHFLPWIIPTRKSFHSTRDNIVVPYFQLISSALTSYLPSLESFATDWLPNPWLPQSGCVTVLFMFPSPAVGMLVRASSIKLVVASRPL
jgi:hypothetical protein